MKESTIAKIRENIETLRAYARGLADLYDVDRDGDDLWTATTLPDGSTVDVNVWIDTVKDHDWLKIAAYPVDSDGQMNGSKWITLFEQPLAQEHNNNEGDF